MAAAMLEGAVLLLAVAYLVEHSPLSLVFALGLLAALAAHFPARSRVARWLEQQTQLLGQQR